MIISLAGHVDHGKTSLVNALTGVMTDRLKEEAERGLTIDLGFAYLTESDADQANGDSPGTLGFVDVPGHHRFIHNMVAGITAQQLALMVIAADDGPMPQTREHLQIMQVLGLQTGIIALTKIDRVESARVSAVKQDIKTLTAGTFLADAPIVEVSSITGEGVPELLNQLRRADQEKLSKRQGSSRLAIDRAFVLKGQGVVVTGTLSQGELHVGDDLYLFPGGEQVKVRSLHAQNKSTEHASAGERCAVNLTGVSAEQVQRGCWLMRNPPTLHQTLCVQLDILENFPRGIKHWSSVHLYHGTSHTLAQVALLQPATGQPGTSILVDLELEEPLNAKRGDRLVLRDHGQDRTIGGAVVIDNAPITTRRRAAERMARLSADLTLSPEAHAAWLLERGGVNVRQFAHLWDLRDDRVLALLEPLPCEIHEGTAHSHSALEDWAKLVHQLIINSPESDGQRRNQLQAQLTQANRLIPDAALDAVLEGLVRTNAVQVTDGRYRKPGTSVSLSEAEQTLLDLMTAQLDIPQPPSLGDIAKRTGRNLDQLKRGMKSLGAKKQLVIVSDSRVFLPKQYFALAELARKIEPFTVREFRDASGLGRNVVIDILESLDAKGYTKRQDDKRSVIGDMQRLRG